MIVEETRAKLNICLLGPFDVRVEGRPLERLHSRKEQWLLALLALRGSKEIARTRLAGLLWPDNSEAQALAYLRRSLYLLKRALGPEAARLRSVSARSLCFDLTGAFSDVAAFDAAIRRGDTASLEMAVALYRGPLLEDCDEDWIQADRSVREQSYLRALETLGESAAARSRPAEALSLLRRLIAKDPLRESAHRALMQALADDGDYAAMTMAYRDLRLLLRREANFDPSPETVALYERLRDRSQRNPSSAPREETTHRSAPAPRPTEQTDGARVGPRSERRLVCPITPLIGRRTALQEVACRLEAARLMTLTGTGGVGKTRVAVQLAQEWAQREAVWFLELAPLATPALLTETVARELQIPEEPDTELEEALCRSLAARSGLLVLDNCEHLLSACARLAERLLQACPALRILATSRQALGITGEVLYPVPGLELPSVGLPAPDSDQRLSGLVEVPAIRLFIERAQAIAPGFRLTAENSSDIVAICRRLDGLPLAIELAAARLKVLTVAQIAHKLDDCFPLLNGGSRTAQPRHQTLQATLDWSYDLLDPAEQAMLHRLGVFAGGAALEEAEALCTQGSGLAGQALDLMQQLVDKSFVSVESVEGSVRYRLLETTRVYVLKKLEQSGEATAIRQRHSEVYADLVERMAEKTERSAPWGLDRLTLESDNIRAALAWLIRPEARLIDVQRSQKMIAGALEPLWNKRSRLRELHYWIERVLARDPTPTPLRTDLEMRAGFTALRLGSLSAAKAHFENSEEAFRTAGNELGVLGTLSAFGKLAEYRGDYATARDLYTRYLSGCRALGFEGGVYSAVNNLGNVALLAGDYAAARSCHEACLAMGRDKGYPVGIAWSLDNLAEVYQAEGDLPEARRLFKESLAIFVDIDQRMGIVDCLQGIGEVACAGPADVHGARVAGRLLGAAERMRAFSGIVLVPADRLIHERAVEQAQQALGETDFRAEWRIGSEMSLEEAVLFAREV